MNSIAEHKIFTPFTIGRVSLRHRVVMAPLTRLRSEQPGDVPGPLMAQYYEQRTSPGRLIITAQTSWFTPGTARYLPRGAGLCRLKSCPKLWTFIGLRP